MNANAYFDIVIIGAGPAGLCFATVLSGHGLKVAIIEKLTIDDISDPKFDGREIALTQNSVRLMQDYGLWQRIEPDAKSQLKEAVIYDGSSSNSLNISHEISNFSELGWLVSNHYIRKSAYDALCDAKLTHGDIDLFFNESVTDVSLESDHGVVVLESGNKLIGKLVVAADSRFSAARRAVGIPADMHDFGKTMLVCCMTHENNHDYKAWEWFDYDRTLALLPMNPEPSTMQSRSSIVITLPATQIARLVNLPEDQFNLEVERYFQKRLGKMCLVSPRVPYPLVSVYPRKLVAQRFATIGDAAVGMHPVTAHGFNFGLLSVDYLSSEVIKAKKSELDFGASELLARYEQKHRRATRPLYVITKLIIDIYTSSSRPAKLFRKVALRIGRRFLPFKKAIANSLTGSH